VSTLGFSLFSLFFVSFGYGVFWVAAEGHSKQAGAQESPDIAGFPPARE
jgi:hypothetical protein